MDAPFPWVKPVDPHNIHSHDAQCKDDWIAMWGEGQGFTLISISVIITGNPAPYSILIFCSQQVVNLPCGQKEEPNRSVLGVIKLVNQSLSLWGWSTAIQSYQTGKADGLSIYFLSIHQIKTFMYGFKVLLVFKHSCDVLVRGGRLTVWLIAKWISNYFCPKPTNAWKQPVWKSKKQCTRSQETNENITKKVETTNRFQEQ